MPLALLALAVGAFGIGTTEFVIMGLLPEVAGTYGVRSPSPDSWSPATRSASYSVRRS
ncbi:hypothetical protein SAVIM40S_08255 [Streptomyces avidinii]